MHYLRLMQGVLLAGVMSSMFAQTANVRVQLNETGIAEWRFLNPKTAEPIGVDQTLEFVNTTGGRTFIVNLPFEFAAEDLKTVYSVAALNRRRLTSSGTSTPVSVSRFVNDVLQAGGSSVTMSDTLEQLRILDERMQAATASSDLTDLNTATPFPPADDGKVLETLYWTAACVLQTDPAALRRLALGEEDPPSLRDALRREAENLLLRLYLGDTTTTPGCPMSLAKSLRDTYHNADAIPGVGVDATKRFEAARLRTSRAIQSFAIKQAIRNVYTTESAAVLKVLEELRPKYQRYAHKNEQAKCHYAFVRAAATLVATYGPDGRIPFSSSLLSLDPALCGSLSTTAMTTDARTYAGAAEAGNIRTLATALQAPITDGAGLEITDCTIAATTTCVARMSIPPNQKTVVSRSLLERRTDRLIQFTAAFFDEAEPPSNATGYAFLSTVTAQALKTGDDSLLKTLREGLPSSAPKQLQFNFAADAGADYALPEKEVARHVRRTSGVGSLGFQFVGPFDLSATLQFKKGEFGGSAATNQVQATQYQAKVFGPIGTILEYGRFTFAKPSSSIAVSEAGEGLRFGFRRFNLGYLIRRESDNEKQTADLDDDDSYAVVSQFSVPIAALRSFLLTGVWGNEKKDITPTTNPTCILRGTNPDGTQESKDRDPCATPYEYATFGFDTRFTIGTSSNLVGTLGAYHSVRNLREEPRRTGGPDDHFAPASNGKGDVALLTVAWSRLIEQNLLKPLEQSKPWFSFTGFVGYGSADDPDTPDTDESYLGENAGYTNDKLFLSTLVRTKPQLGKGLANKWYAGVQYSNATWSPLLYIADLLKASSEVESTSTTVTLHKYHLVRDIHCGTAAVSTCDASLAQGKRNGGYEVDLEFLIETPKNVRWTVGGAWYRRSAAVAAVGINRNPWMATANVSIKFNAR